MDKKSLITKYFIKLRGHRLGIEPNAVEESNPKNHFPEKRVVFLLKKIFRVTFSHAELPVFIKNITLITGSYACESENREGVL